MTAPNLMVISSVVGKLTGANLTTSHTSILSNASNSNKLLRINSVVVTNINGLASADASVSVYKNQTTDYYVASTISVPADATLVVATKDMNLYLEENDSLRASAALNNYLQILVSYEEVQ